MCDAGDEKRELPVTEGTPKVPRLPAGCDVEGTLEDSASEPCGCPVVAAAALKRDDPTLEPGVAEENNEVLANPSDPFVALAVG